MWLILGGVSVFFLFGKNIVLMCVICIKIIIVNKWGYVNYEKYVNEFM